MQYCLCAVYKERQMKLYWKIFYRHFGTYNCEPYIKIYIKYNVMYVNECIRDGPE
jgi:hypothetical protein